MSTLIVPAKVIPRDPFHTRQAGTSPAEVWYPIGIASCTTLGTVIPANGNLRALAFYSGRGGTIDRIAMNVTSGQANSLLRFGIYTNTSDANNYPNSLVVDSGEFDASTNGIKSATVSIQLEANQLYWAAYLIGTSNPTVRAVTQANLINMLGTDNTLGTTMNLGWTVTQAYGALPSTFTGGGAAYAPGASYPAIFVRYSS